MSDRLIGDRRVDTESVARSAEDVAPSALQPLIHIGYHKTATTWLQNFLFTDKSCGVELPIKPIVVDRIIRGPSSFEFDPEVTRALLLEELGPVAQRGSLPILSSETLSGNPHSGGYDSRDTADRIHAMFPESRLLIVIREQRALIASSYKQYVRVGGRCRIEDYLEPPSDRRIPLFRFRHFEYHHLIGYYRSLFGQDRVLVLPFEEFRDRPGRFVGRLASFAGFEAPVDAPYARRVNEAVPMASLLVQRYLNGLSKRGRTTLNPQTIGLRPVDLVISTLRAIDPIAFRGVSSRLDRRLKRIVDDVVEERYAESNRRTSRIAGLDLAALGYPT